MIWRILGTDDLPELHIQEGCNRKWGPWAYAEQSAKEAECVLRRASG